MAPRKWLTLDDMAWYDYLLDIAEFFVQEI